MELGTHELATVICYEDMFPAFVNERFAGRHPEMLITLTNDAWFGDTTEPWGHLAVAHLRAVEHRVYSVRAAESGVTAVIDPGGRLVRRSETYREEAIDADVRWMPAHRTVYELCGDSPWWIAAAVTLLFSAVGRPGAERPRRRSIETPPGSGPLNA